jgi:hypothetical protein
VDFLGGGEFRHPPKDQLPDVIVTCFALCLVELSFFLRPHRPVTRPPLPLAAQRALIAESVAQRAQAAKPTVNVLNDQLRINWGEGTGVTALLCWAMPDVMIDALARELREASNALGQPERERKAAELSSDLLALEFKESLGCACCGNSGPH